MIEVPLHSKKYPGLSAVVDEGDMDLISSYRWYPKKKKGGVGFYAGTSFKDNGIKKHLTMHQVITGSTEMDTDHINGDGLDNRRENLRLCTHRDNIRNMVKRIGLSAYRGVCWHNQRNRWLAQIKTKDGNRSLGLHDTEEEAARAYDTAARKHFGSFGRFNFPLPGEQQA